MVSRPPNKSESGVRIGIFHYAPGQRAADVRRPGPVSAR